MVLRPLFQVMISLSGTSTSVAWFRDEWCCSAKCATSKYTSNIKVHPRENTENVWKKCTASSLRFEHVSSLKQTLQSHHMSSPLAPLVTLPLRVTGLAPRAFSLDTWQDSITKQHGGSMWLVAHHRPSSSFIILHQNHQTACLLHGHQRSWACGRDPDFIRECNATRPPKIRGFERVFYRNILCVFFIFDHMKDQSSWEMYCFWCVNPLLYSCLLAICSSIGFW
jgi:hypothetical protein